jgi:SAM-dependent methyltransferase
MRQNQELIWKHFQNHAPDSFGGAGPRLNYLIRRMGRLSRVAKPVVLNVGVGSGYLERELLVRGWQTHALDPDGESLAKLAADGVIAHTGCVEAMPLESRTFDFVVTSEVLEHLSVEQRRAGLMEIARVLKPGGWFLGTVPYEENLAANQVVCPDCGVVFHRWGHQKSFTREDVAQELSPHFTHIEIRRTAFVAFSRGLTGNIKSLVRLLLAKCGQPVAVPSILWQAQKP